MLKISRNMSVQKLKYKETYDARNIEKIRDYIVDLYNNNIFLVQNHAEFQNYVVMDLDVLRSMNGNIVQ